MSGLYIHIPFCKQACSYCDFYFITRTQLREPFIDVLEEEIRSYGNSPMAEETIKTLYIGGGTPSLIKPGQMEQIFSALRESFELDLTEVTIEMNPDDVTHSYLESLIGLGVNRASMGVQSFHPELLSFMNRAHSREEALKSLELLNKAGFETYTVDLIYGNPGESLDELEEDLETLMEYSPPHLSAYSLTVEPRTRLGKQVELGRIDPPDDDKVADHFDLVIDTLASYGIEQYEVSNFCRPGSEAVHNSNYWRHENYLGLGPGAHSFWWDAERALRWKNRKDIKSYLDNPAAVKDENEKLTRNELAEERLMMGLRTREGVALNELNERYDYELNERQCRYLEMIESEGKAEFDDAIRLTRRGFKIADAITLDLITMQ